MVLGICCALCGTEIGSAGGVRRRPFGYGGGPVRVATPIVLRCVLYCASGCFVPRSGMVLHDDLY